MQGPYSSEIIRDLTSLRELAPEWSEVAPAADVEPWQSFGWMEAAASSCDGSQSLRIITVRKNGSLAAVAPMVLKRSDQPLRPLRLDILGGEELKEPNRFVQPDPGSMDLLIDSLVSEPVYPIRLSRIPGDAETITDIRRKFAVAGWITRLLSMPYPYLDLGANPLKKSLKEDLRRARRKAEAFGEIRAATVMAADERLLLERLDRALGIEASGWKGRNGTAIICNEFRKSFFQRYVCSAWREGTLRLMFLNIGGADAAYQLAVESANAYWLLNIGFDEQYRDCSPGKLLLGVSVEEAAKSGLARYNLLGKEEPWISHWTSSVRDSLVLAAYRPNTHGFAAMASDALYLLRKRLKDRRTNRVKRSHTSPAKG